MVRTKKVSSSKNTSRSWYHAIDAKHVHILVKFERRLSTQFGRKKPFFTKKDWAIPFEKVLFLFFSHKYKCISRKEQEVYIGGYVWGKRSLEEIQVVWPGAEFELQRGPPCPCP
jgi:hypothetical protein